MIFAVDLIASAFTGTIVNQWQRTLFRRGNRRVQHLLHPTDPNVAAADIEENCLDILQAVKSTVKIPVAVTRKMRCKAKRFLVTLCHQKGRSFSAHSLCLDNAVMPENSGLLLLFSA